jgi:hypothetical protein
MSVDETLRLLLLIAIAATGAYWLLGGLFTRISGRWRDGNREIHLRQFGPLITGSATRPGGSERYVGTALWGRVRLRRHDRGAAHLQSLGFAQEVAPLLEDSLMATFDLRLTGSLLDGYFQGRIIRSERVPPRIISVRRTPPQERCWTRIS